MKHLFAIIVVLAIFSNKQAYCQNNKTKQPKVDIKVNKEFDQDGNLIKYDSVYSSVYSNFETDSLFSDSIIDNFNQFFNHSYSPIISHHFNQFFENDSVFGDDFFHDDFFFGKFQQNNEMFDEMFKELDSLKNSFFLKNKNSFHYN